MFQRQKTGSVVCPSCGNLVGVNDDECLNCGRKNPGMWGFAHVLSGLGKNFSFLPIAMGGCLVLYLFQLVMEPGRIGGLLAPGPCASVQLGSSGFEPVVLMSRWWTVLSAGWLHGNLLHIGFNLMWIRQLGPFAGEAFGTSRSTILYLLSGVGGFVATTVVRSFVRFGGLSGIIPGPLVGADYTLGASAAIFGWIGALIYFGRRTGRSALSSQLMWGAAVPLAVIGLLWPSIDNWAHFGGFVTGYLGAMVLDPLKPERVNHTFLAFVLIALTALSIVVSLMVALPAATGC